MDARLYRRTGALALAALLALTACNPTGRAERAAAAETRKLAHETFAQAAEPGRCAEGCARQEAGFAHARAKALIQADDCIGAGDEDFVEGCRQYGEDIDDAYRRALYRQATDR